MHQSKCETAFWSPSYGISRMYHDRRSCMYYDHGTCKYYDHSTCMYYGHSTCMCYDPSTCMYQDHKTCMYHNHSACMYYDRSTCTYYEHSTCMYYDHSTCMYYDHRSKKSFGCTNLQSSNPTKRTLSTYSELSQTCKLDTQYNDTKVAYTQRIAMSILFITSVTLKATSRGQLKKYLLDATGPPGCGASA